MIKKQSESALIDGWRTLCITTTVGRVLEGSLRALAGASDVKMGAWLCTVPVTTN